MKSCLEQNNCHRNHSSATSNRHRSSGDSSKESWHWKHDGPLDKEKGLDRDNHGARTRHHEDRQDRYHLGSGYHHHEDRPDKNHHLGSDKHHHDRDRSYNDADDTRHHQRKWSKRSYDDDTGKVDNGENVHRLAMMDPDYSPDPAEKGDDDSRDANTRRRKSRTKYEDHRQEGYYVS